MSGYYKSYRFERRVKRYFEEDGWTFFRQGKSSFTDLIYLRATSYVCLLTDLKCHRETTEVQLIECKVDRSGITNDERQRLKELAESISVECFGAFAYLKGRKIRFETVT